MTPFCYAKKRLLTPVPNRVDGLVAAVLADVRGQGCRGLTRVSIVDRDVADCEPRNGVRMRYITVREFYAYCWLPTQMPNLPRQPMSIRSHSHHAGGGRTYRR